MEIKPFSDNHLALNTIIHIHQQPREARMNAKPYKNVLTLQKSGICNYSIQSKFNLID